MPMNANRGVPALPTAFDASREYVARVGRGDTRGERSYRRKGRISPRSIRATGPIPARARASESRHISIGYPRGGLAGPG